MMKMKIEKGQYGYRDYHKRIQLCKVALGAAMIIAQLLARNLTDNESARNILTVMAVLSVLPTANVASPLLASWRYRTISAQFYQTAKPYEHKGILLYDLILTTKEQIIGADMIFIHPHGVYLYCPDQKIDRSKAEKALNDIFAGHRLDRNVKILNDAKNFIDRLEAIRPMRECEDDGSPEYAAAVLKNLSM